MNIIELDTQLTRKNYAKLLIFGTLRSSYFYLLMAIVFVYVLWAFLTKSAFTYALITLGIIILYFLIWILFRLFSKKGRIWFSKRHLTLNEYGIIVKSPTFELVIRWDAFTTWEKIGGYYVLHMSDGNICPISRSDIPDSEKTYFQNLLSSKINKISFITPTKS
jgi:hypothetical protein